MEMIKITQPNGEAKLFQSYHNVCSYINSLERRKTLETGKSGWRFIKRRHDTLYFLYYRTPSLKIFFTPKEKEAIEKELGLIEISKGDEKNIIQILFRSKLDIEPLKMDWCKDYCNEHSLELCELVMRT